MMDDKTPRRKVLEEAADLIDGDRNVTYGTPTQNFTNIAELWTTRFRHMLKDGAEFAAHDVADAMILLKIARNIADVKRDNFVDIAGYAGCGWEAFDSIDHALDCEAVQGDGEGKAWCKHGERVDGWSEAEPTVDIYNRYATANPEEAELDYLDRVKARDRQ